MLSVVALVSSRSLSESFAMYLVEGGMRGAGRKQNFTILLITTTRKETNRAAVCSTHFCVDNQRGIHCPKLEGRSRSNEQVGQA